MLLMTSWCVKYLFSDNRTYLFVLSGHFCIRMRPGILCLRICKMFCIQCCVCRKRQSMACPGRGGLHLNKKGSGRLAVNFISYNRRHYQLELPNLPRFCPTENRLVSFSTLNVYAKPFNHTPYQNDAMPSNYKKSNVLSFRNAIGIGSHPGNDDNNSTDVQDVLSTLPNLRLNNNNRVMIAHLNINSLRN